MSVYFYVYLKYDKKAEEHTLQAVSNVHTKAGNTVEIFYHRKQCQHLKCETLHVLPYRTFYKEEEQDEDTQ